MLKLSKPLVVAIAVILLILILGIVNSYRISSHRSVVEFDLNGAKAEFIKEASSAHVSHDKLQELLGKFGQALELSVKQYANSHDVIILVKPSVIAGAADVTPQIEALIGQNIKRVTKSAPRQSTKMLGVS